MIESIHTNDGFEENHRFEENLEEESDLDAGVRACATLPRDALLQIAEQTIAEQDVDAVDSASDLEIASDLDGAAESDDHEENGCDD